MVEKIPAPTIADRADAEDRQLERAQRPLQPGALLGVAEHPVERLQPEQL
jgi:hypothetical protein